MQQAINNPKRLSAQCMKQRGFSLIELIIALAIVALLATIALPAYRDAVREGRRADAHASLTEAASRQEQYFLDNKSYATTMTALGYSASPAASHEGYYQLSVTAATATCPITTCYLLSAAPQGGQSGDSCGTLSLSSLGVRTPSGCW